MSDGIIYYKGQKYGEDQDVNLTPKIQSTINYPFDEEDLTKISNGEEVNLEIDKQIIGPNLNFNMVIPASVVIKNGVFIGENQESILWNSSTEVETVGLTNGAKMKYNSMNNKRIICQGIRVLMGDYSGPSESPAGEAKYASTGSFHWYTNYTWNEDNQDWEFVEDIKQSKLMNGQDRQSMPVYEHYTQPNTSNALWRIIKPEDLYNNVTFSALYSTQGQSIPQSHTFNLNINSYINGNGKHEFSFSQEDMELITIYNLDIDTAGLYFCADSFDSTGISLKVGFAAFKGNELKSFVPPASQILSSGFGSYSLLNAQPTWSMRWENTKEYDYARGVSATYSHVLKSDFESQNNGG